MLAACQLHPWRFKLDFFPSRLPCGQPYKFCFEAKPHLVFCHKVYEITLSKVLTTEMGVTEAQHQSQLVWIVQIWPIFTSQWVSSTGTRAQLCFGLLVCCYSLLQHSRPAWLELFVNHTHTHSMNNLRLQPHWLLRLTSLRESHVTDGEPKTAVSASLQKRDTSERLHLVVNFEKSKVVIFRNGTYIAAREKRFYNTMKLKIVNHYKYLAVIFSTGITFSSYTLKGKVQGF